MATCGDTIPGIGRIGSIVRWANRWIVATAIAVFWPAENMSHKTQNRQNYEVSRSREQREENCIVQAFTVDKHHEKFANQKPIRVFQGPFTERNSLRRRHIARRRSPCGP
jgi:hypothetical protein